MFHHPAQVVLNTSSTKKHHQKKTVKIRPPVAFWLAKVASLLVLGSTLRRAVSHCYLGDRFPRKGGISAKLTLGWTMSLEGNSGHVHQNTPGRSQLLWTPLSFLFGLRVGLCIYACTKGERERERENKKWNRKLCVQRCFKSMVRAGANLPTSNEAGWHFGIIKWSDQSLLVTGLLSCYTLWLCCIPVFVPTRLSLAF